MTTAHRPTYRPAIGGSEQGGNKMLVHSRSYHSKDLPAYLILKMRKPGQGTQAELEQKDFKLDLIKERKREEDKESQRLWEYLKPHQPQKQHKKLKQRCLGTPNIEKDQSGRKGNLPIGC